VGADGLQSLQIEILKNANFVDVISKVLRDLLLSRNQLLKSAYDSCIENLKNKIKI
jgi:hypothetical protein